MCYEPTARPPVPPIAGAAGDVARRGLVLTAEDGNRFAAFSATDGSPGGPGIVILPDVRGLHAFYQELAVRVAEAGIHATALDYFGRTAGVGSGEARGDGFEYAPHVAQLRPETIASDVAATIAHLRSARGGEATAIFTMGFCLGGRASFNQAARQRGLHGVIGFYGGVAPRDPEDTTAPTLLASSYTCPVLGLFGGADRGISSEDVAAFRRALDQAGIRNELVTYEGAPHSFFDRAADQYREACDDAWRRVLDFVRTNAG
jgi:carboxymethylenebutenolidase